MKKIITLSLLLLSATVSFAQRSLAIKEVTDGLNVFSGKDTEAGMVISCPGNIELTFESTHDKEVDVFSKELKGENMYYYLRFNTGKKYRGRKLTIRAEGFIDITLGAELSPKQLKEFELEDPDADFVYGCYYEYRKRGNEFFEKSMYSEAKENYIIAKSSSDCPADNNIDKLISDIDSIAVYTKRAEEAADLLDYNTAISNYTNVLALNPNDESVRTLRNTYLNTYRTEYKKYFDMAEVYKAEGEYEKALTLYEKVIDSQYSNTYAQISTEEAKRLRILIRNRQQHAKVLLYEYSVQTPIGISSGTFKTRKAGGYFNLSIHQDIFTLLRSQYDLCDQAELNFTPIGINFNIVPEFPHFWFMAGLGYTGTAKYENEDGSIYIPGTYQEDSGMEKPKLALYHAISPETGLLVKVWRVSLKYTFQYRYALGAEYSDRITPFRHSFGLGINF